MNPYDSPDADFIVTKVPVDSSSKNLTPIAFYLGLLIVAAGTLALAAKTDNPIGALFFVPFVFGPLILFLRPMWTCRKAASQIVLSLAGVAYAIFFGWVYADVFYLHPDPNSVIGLLFVGIYAFPVLLIVAILVLVFEHIAASKNSKKIGRTMA